MEKHKFDVTCPSSFFVESTLGPPEYEKWCIDVSRHGHNGMHYMTRRSYQMKKYKFGIMCPEALLSNPY
jgi:hypothetical protein